MILPRLRVRLRCGKVRGNAPTQYLFGTERGADGDSVGGSSNRNNNAVCNDERGSNARDSATVSEGNRGSISDGDAERCAALLNSASCHGRRAKSQQAAAL